MANTSDTAQKPRKVRGTGIYAGDEFTFKPTAEGTPSQLDVKSCRNGKLFRTTSQRRPLKVAHLSCPDDAPDPWTEYTNCLKQLGIRPLKETTLPTRQRIVDEAGMQVFLNQSQRQVLFQGTIDLDKHRNWQSEVMRLLQVIVRTLPACEKFKKVINTLKREKR